jgi:LysR family transcriptional regulator, hydrogen peroxide-inducible genes activator
MEMHQVRYFLAVAQELNFSRAAEKCNVSQPSLSRAIQQLEGELGGPLFHRERHLTHLTDLGEMVRPHLETVYEAAVKVKHLSQDPQSAEESAPQAWNHEHNITGRDC